MSFPAYIQRLPRPGDRWWGLNDVELQYVLAALSVTIVGSGKVGNKIALEGMRESLRKLPSVSMGHLQALWRDADAEAKRRAHTDEPVPNYRWSALTNLELVDVMVALNMALKTYAAGPPGSLRTERVTALAETVADELGRRSDRNGDQGQQT